MESSTSEKRLSEGLRGLGPAASHPAASCLRGQRGELDQPDRAEDEAKVCAYRFLHQMTMTMSRPSATITVTTTVMVLSGTGTTFPPAAAGEE